MKVIDLNILLYAVNRDSPTHVRARHWLDDVLSSDETIGIPWVVVLGFLRMATNARVFARPLTGDQALAVADAWLAQPNVTALSVADSHWSILRPLLADATNVGASATDAHLAALAIENGAELCSADSDFRRFEGLRWRNPLADADA